MPSGSPRVAPNAQAEIELVFTEPLAKEFECPVCEQVLRYPVQFDQCDHHCCSSCLPDLARKGGVSRCPIDQKEFNRDKVFVDKNLQRTIQALGVKCSYHDKSCPWTGQLKEVPSHIPDCEFAPVKCPRGCGLSFERRFQDKHLSSDCAKRAVGCEHCGREVKQSQLEEHYKACPRYPSACPNGCGAKSLAREDLKSHLKKCPKAGSACPFAEFGCMHKGDRNTLQTHIREQPTKHLSILCDGVVELKALLATMQMNLERMGQKMDELAAKTEALEKLYGAQLLWKIEGYTTKFNEAKSGAKTTVFSPPFLTGRHGYKMAMSACLYGDGKVRGKQMSLFICLCKGDYDALLSWPFAHRVTFTLLDQCQDPAARRNIVYTVKPNTCKENRPFLGRPSGERNASFGAQKFCELGMLEKLDYIRDDTIFIKVTVDTEDMTPI